MAPQPFELLHREADFVAIEKPPGFHVHQPEYPRRRVDPDVICLSHLRRQIQEYLFPVHRLDVATEGVLLFALKKEAASALCRQFQEGQVRKTYFALARGWLPDAGIFDEPLALDSTGDLVPAVTAFKTHARIEQPVAVGKRHASARYSLVEARPETGRYHQVRRHLSHVSHPIIGDAIHGDSHHNRHFRLQLELPGLWLKAKDISFNHPTTGARVHIESQWSERWLQLFAKLNLPVPRATPAEGDLQ